MKWVGVGLIVKKHCISIISDFEDFFGSEDIVSQFKLTGKRSHSSGCLLRGDKGYRVIVFRRWAFIDISSFFGFTRFDLVTFQSFSTFLHLKRS